MCRFAKYANANTTHMIFFCRMDSHCVHPAITGTLAYYLISTLIIYHENLYFYIIRMLATRMFRMP